MGYDGFVICPVCSECGKSPMIDIESGFIECETVVCSRYDKQSSFSDWVWMNKGCAEHMLRLQTTLCVCGHHLVIFKTREYMKGIGVYCPNSECEFFLKKMSGSTFLSGHDNRVAKKTEWDNKQKV
jgi:hypothetical protein